MTELETLQRLLSEGYLISGYLLPMAHITPESVDRAIEVFSIETARSDLLNPSNSGETLIMLRNYSTGGRFEILTSDSEVIEEARKQYDCQNEPVGTIITASCVSLAGGYHEQPIFNVADLIRSLEGFGGWEFEVADSSSSFTIKINLPSAEKTEISKAKEQVYCTAPGFLDTTLHHA
jgi:hypothetical protein